MLHLLKEMIKYSSTPLFVQPNAGLPVSINGVTTYNVTPEEFANKQLQILKNGACALGGCCGTNPDHIKAMIDLCKNEEIIKISKKYITAVTSYSKTVIFQDKPIIIGERINPTGKKLLKEALRNNDMDYIYREGVTQVDAGADILDVNVGLPEIDEPTMMQNAVLGLQSILSTPLQIDTSDAVAMGNALRIYNGKAMVNSVNGKEKVMEEVFPLVKKYGGVLVCLTLDEAGIPETVDGRIDIAKRIIKKAEEYGIEKENLVFDPLCMTVSTNKDNAKITLECIEKLTKDLGVKTVLGVSNVSFGLPNRELLNSTFFILAMQKGLSAGIINPKSEAMMNAYYSFNALMGLDDNFEQYTYVKSKDVYDSDGWRTEYTMYYDEVNDRYVFVFGDSDLYDPNDGYEEFDWECDTEREANEWFDNYNGFEDDLDESICNEALRYYVTDDDYIPLKAQPDEGYTKLQAIQRAQREAEQSAKLFKMRVADTAKWYHIMDSNNKILRDLDNAI
jgi:5-methyltetrahydrofolate--homocysteine methyltransferase